MRLPLSYGRLAGRSGDHVLMHPKDLAILKEQLAADEQMERAVLSVDDGKGSFLVTDQDFGIPGFRTPAILCRAEFYTQFLRAVPETDRSDSFPCTFQAGGVYVYLVTSTEAERVILQVRTAAFRKEIEHLRENGPIVNPKQPSNPMSFS